MKVLGQALPLVAAANARKDTINAADMVDHADGYRSIAPRAAPRQPHHKE
jgi:hypothetical protein